MGTKEKRSLVREGPIKKIGREILELFLLFSNEKTTDEAP